MEPNNKQQNSLYNLPRQIFDTFKIHGRRKHLSNNGSYTFVIEKEWFHRRSALRKEVKSITKRLYNLSNSSTFLCKSFISTNFNTNLKNYLTYQQLNVYNKCLEYIKDNNLPNYYSYYIIDFLASTGDKFLHLNEQDIFHNIAMRYILNTKSVLTGVSSPKPQESIYNTLPKAFSPLFFYKTQFASIILRGKKIRKDFEDCLNHTFIEQLKSSTIRILQAHNQQELDFLINQTLNNIQSYWWVPETVLTRLNQMKLYINNLFGNYPVLLEFIIFSYLCYISDYGLNQNNFENCSCAKLFEDMTKCIRLSLQRAGKESRNGWSIFDSKLQKDGCVYNTLLNLCQSLSNNLSKTKALKLSTNSPIKRARLISKTYSNIHIA